MKPIVTLFVLWLVALQTSQAQPSLYAHQKCTPMQRWQQNRAIIHKAVLSNGNEGNCMKQKTTAALAERLIATSSYNIYDTSVFPIGLTDTASFSYSVSRSSIFNYTNMVYDNTYIMEGSGPLVFSSTFGYNNPNNSPDMLSDTSYRWTTSYLTRSMYLVSRQYSLYDTNYNVTDYALVVDTDRTLSGSANERYMNSFDAFANVSSSYGFRWSYGNWDTDQHRTFYYDASHRIVKDSTNSYYMGTWVPYGKWLYSYNSMGKLAVASFFADNGIGWHEEQRYTLVYNADSTLKMDTVRNYSYSDSAFVITIIDSFGYTHGVSYPTTSKIFDYSGGTFTGVYYLFTKHVNAALAPDTCVFEAHLIGSGLYERLKDVFTYDSYNEPVTDMQYKFNIIDTAMGTGWYDSTQPYAVGHFYYELYYARPSHTAVTSINEAPTNIKAYPNPATNYLTLEAEGITPGAQVAVTLYDVAGRVMLSHTISWTGNKTQLPLEGLTPGVYSLQVTGPNGVVHHSKIVKQ